MSESLKPSQSTEPALIFPILKGKMAPPSIRSIDEIDSWIEHDYAFFYDQEKFLEEKKKMSVYDKFVLK
jgi:hypothetical protein